MKHRLLYLLYLVTIFVMLLTGCNRVIRDEIDAFQSQIDNLGVDFEELNTNISSLGAIVEEELKGEFLKEYHILMEEGKEVGYVLTYSDGRTITIYHGKEGEDGKDGDDGRMPSISVKQDQDGLWYWTLDGLWLREDSGEKIKAIGEDGVAGENGIAPKLKIDNGYWYISYDGESWMQLDKATGNSGARGDAIFQTVEDEEDAIILTLSDGTVLTIMKNQPFTLTLSESILNMVDGITYSVPFTIIGSTGDTEVYADCSSRDWSVSINMTDAHHGTVSITANTGAESADVAVWASNGQTMVMSVIEARVKNYFRISNYTDQKGTITFTRNGEPNDIKLRTSTDGIHWTDTQTLTETTQFDLPAKGFVLFDGAENSAFSTGFVYYGYGYWTITTDVNHSVSGNIMTLIGSAQGLKMGEFYSLFSGDNALVSAGELILSEELPAGAGECYREMFKDCTQLISAPKLPSTTLANGCYAYMFAGCSRLVVAPRLPAKDLIDCCYYGMFSGCSALSSAPELPSTNLAFQCYSHMFMDCTSLTIAPDLPATLLAQECYQMMFWGCSVLTKAPDLPATTLTRCCYQGMFAHCLLLSEAPKLGVFINAPEACCMWMFADCENLRDAPALPAMTLEYMCYTGMFGACYRLAKAPSLPATTLAEACYAAMFSGCSRLTEAPVLPAKTLVKMCYADMFSGCSSLYSLTCLATDISAEHCTHLWITGVGGGTFKCASGMSDVWPRNESGCPSSWNIVEE